jgi:hypothetical protein
MKIEGELVAVACFLLLCCLFFMKKLSLLCGLLLVCLAVFLAAV